MSIETGISDYHRLVLTMFKGELTPKKVFLNLIYYDSVGKKSNWAKFVKIFRFN